MPYRRTPAVQARLDATRARIVESGLALVAEGGWEAARVTAIAERAGVATGTVYRHVDDKDALCGEVFRRAAGRELAHVADAAAGTDPARVRVERALRTFAERALRAPRLASALLADPAPPAVEVERRRFRRDHRDVFRSVVADGVARGEVAACDTEIVAAALVGAMGEALLGPLAAVEPGAPDGAIDELVATCLRALPPPPEPTVASLISTAGDATGH